MLEVVIPTFGLIGSVIWFAFQKGWVHRLCIEIDEVNNLKINKHNQLIRVVVKITNTGNLKKKIKSCRVEIKEGLPKDLKKCLTNGYHIYDREVIDYRNYINDLTYVKPNCFEKIVFEFTVPIGYKNLIIYTDINEGNLSSEILWKKTKF